jgi:glycosyltransferase involved in cell wall biosynthesis
LVDATAVPRNRGGVGRYVDSIVSALVESGTVLTVVCQTHDLAEYKRRGINAVAAPKRIESILQRFLWEQFALPRLARKLKVDVVHSPHYTFPIFMRTRRVVTLHDMTFFSHPKAHTVLKRRFFSLWIYIAKWMKVVAITPSQATADEFIRVVGGDKNRVVVSHLGFNADQFHPPTAADIERFQVQNQLPSGWIAFLGTLEPRKNTAALIGGYVHALANVPVSERPALLLAGGEGWDTAVNPAIARARTAGFEVRKLGYVPLDELPSFLGGATIVAYPSLGEGFGLPVLEAMATGACVVTTEKLAIPEIGGDAVAYTGTSAIAIGAALISLLNDAPRRKRLGAAGIVRAASFTWRLSAGRHREAYLLAADETAQLRLSSTVETAIDSGPHSAVA